MRVLHAGNFSYRAKGAFMHGVAPKISRGLVRLGHAVVDFSDRDIARAGSLLGSRKLGLRAVNTAFTELVRQIRPDVVLLGHADTLRADTLAALRRDIPSLRVVQWNVDPLFEPDNVRRLSSKFGVVDATLVSTAGPDLAALKHPGMQTGFLPNPVDFSIESGAAHENPSPPHDLFYAFGHPTRPRRELFGQAWDMSAFFAEFRRRAPGLRMHVAGLDGTPHAAGAAYAELLASCAMGLNFSRRNDVPLYSSDRLAHLAGNGQAVLMPRGSGYDTLFTPGQMAFFGDFDSLVTQATGLAADPAARMALAASGRARYHALFNEIVVARYILDVATGTHDAAAYEWPSLIV